MKKQKYAADVSRIELIRMLAPIPMPKGEPNYLDCVGRFAGICLDGLDLSGLRLTNLDFSYASLRGCIFRDTDIRACYFDSVDFTDADFRGCHFMAEELMGFAIFFSGANFTRANLNSVRAHGDGTMFENCDFTDADLRGTDFENVSAIGATFRNAKLEGAIFTGAKLSPGALPKRFTRRAVRNG